MKIFIFGIVLSLNAFAVPDNNWIMRQIWNNLSFTHYEVNETELRKIVPKQLKIDKHQDRAFVGIVTLEMSTGNINSIPIPLYSPFPQINVRTYVTCNGKRGIYFFNIDADHTIATTFASMLFSLPYYKANISWEKNKDRYYFFSDAKDRNFEISFKPKKETIPDDAASLEIWLTDIYQSYQIDKKNKVQESKLWHSPFVVQKLDAKIIKDDAFEVLNLQPIDGPSFHYVEKTETFFWKNKEVKCN